MKPSLFKYLSWIFLVIILFGCSHEQEPVEKQSKSVDYLRIPLNKFFYNIDPSLTFWGSVNTIELVEQLFLGLTDFDLTTYEVIPELATSWKANQDGTVYTFYLRKDVKWTDGKPLTAHDIVWTVQRNLLSGKAIMFKTLYILKNAESIYLKNKTAQDLNYNNFITSNDTLSSLGIRAIDDYTVEFTLEHPAGYFPSLVSTWIFRPLPRKVIEQYDDNWTDHIQTNGPYKLDSWSKGNKLILKKNPDYYAATKVKISEIHYYIVPKPSLALAMYENNELDIISQSVSLPQSELQRLNIDPILRKEVHSKRNFCTLWYGFNTQKAPMNNVLVRKAIAAAIDKNNLIKFVINDHHSPATTFTPTPVFGAVEADKEIGIQFSPRQAQKWLTEAGYPNGAGFPLIVLGHDNSDTLNKTYTSISKMLKYYLNINVRLQTFDRDSYNDALKQPSSLDMFDITWCADYPDANNWLYDVFHPNKGLSWISWYNEEFVETIEQAQQIFDPQERKKLYQRAETILNQEEVAIIPIYFENTQFLVKPWVKGWENTGFGGQRIHTWWLE
ncbi:peptide ABC transporter substrate-binding protein [Candidatus Halobeggiatoa sp. HSG11]|nr:peptide ABC transporter substrate-binding protein [Candidatus Halobeggiatoa sp. HSG11]